jgi:hypothetical protein
MVTYFYYQFLGHLHRVLRSTPLAKNFSFTVVHLYLYDLFVGKKFQLDYRNAADYLMKTRF